jgi:hypothetical protein
VRSEVDNTFTTINANSTIAQLYFEDKSLFIAA